MRRGGPSTSRPVSSATAALPGRAADRHRLQTSVVLEGHSVLHDIPDRRRPLQQFHPIAESARREDLHDLRGLVRVGGREVNLERWLHR